MPSINTPLGSFRDRSFRAFRHSNFRWYYLSGLGASADMGMRQLLIPWLVLDLTGSIAQLGIVVFMQGFPMALVALFGGVLADRYNRRSLLIYTQFLIMGIIAILAFLTISEVVELWHIYFSSVLLGIVQAMGNPSRQAFIANLVTKDDRMNAVALNSMLQHSTRVIWPFLTGWLIISWGIGYTLAINATCLVVGIGGMLMVRIVNDVHPAKTASPLNEIKNGIKYVSGSPVVGMVLIVTQMLGLFGLVLLHMGPGFAREEMGLNAAQTGVFMMFMGIGAIIGSVLMASLNIEHKAKWYVIHCLLMAISLFALALNPSYLLAFVIMGMYGYANSIQVILSNTIFQLVVPLQFLGRVSSLWFFAGGLASIAALPIGILGELFGLRVALGGSASLMFLSIVWFAFISPPGRRTGSNWNASDVN
jgi:MFS family permease